MGRLTPFDNFCFCDFKKRLARSNHFMGGLTRFDHFSVCDFQNRLARSTDSFAGKPATSRVLSPGYHVAASVVSLLTKQITALPCPAPPCLALSCPALLCLALPCPALSCPALPCLVCSDGSRSCAWRMVSRRDSPDPQRGA